MKLWSYWRSSCSYRVRIALNLKGLDYEVIPVHLTKNGGEQHREDYRDVNPQGLVPAFQVAANESILTQSLSIIEYIEDRWPAPALLPQEYRLRARVRSLGQLLASEVQPLQNLRVIQHLKSHLQVRKEHAEEWMRYWMLQGFDAFEKQLQATDRYCVGNAVTMADLVLVPQVYNARRFNLDLSNHPKILGIEERCLQLPAFLDARPANQPDAPPR